MANISFKDMRMQIHVAMDQAHRNGLDSPTSHVHGEYYHYIDGLLTLAALCFPRASGSTTQRKAEIREMVKREFATPGTDLFGAP